MGKRSAKRTQFLRDVMGTALEGGVNYWSAADEITRSPGWGGPDTDEWYYVSYVLYCYGDDDESCGNGVDDKCKGHTVDIETVAHGLAVICGLTKYSDDVVGMHRTHRARIGVAHREGDAGEIDAGDADNVVQAGIFESVIYA